MTDTTASKVLEITTDNFATKTDRAGLPTLLDFGAPWCPPCRMLKPELGKVAETYAGRVQVGHVDVDREPALADRFGVRSVPTLLVIKDGHVLGQLVGAVPRSRIDELLSTALG